MLFRLAAVGVLALALASCGDNRFPSGDALATAQTLTIVAHQDDDLLFMQPDNLEAAASGQGLTNVYVTAGNNREGYGYAEERYRGLRAAYSAITGTTEADWSCGWIEIAGHAAQHCRLEAARVSLVFLAYPDGGLDGSYSHSLLRLWEGELGEVETVAENATHYDRAGLIATLAEIITATEPVRIHSLEIASTHGDDHSDHMIVGALAVLATAQVGIRIPLVSYRGYSTEDEPANLSPPILARSSWPMEHYDACTGGCSAACGDACPRVEFPPHGTYIARRYAVGMRGGELTGVLATGGQCAQLGADGSSIVLGACDPLPPAWTLGADGTIAVAPGHCLAAQTDGALAIGACTPGPAGSFRLDDEGHVWLGTPPAPVPGMDYAHLLCLTPTGGSIDAELCGKPSAPRWTLQRPVIATARAPLGTGALRLLDVDGDGHADLCAATDLGSLCALGDGTGAFAAPVAMPALPVDPAAGASALTGDLDGDGVPDWCAFGDDGPLCSVSAELALTADPSPWAFSQAGVVEGGAVLATSVLGDVTGDGRADLCSLLPGEVSCALTTSRGFAPRTSMLALPAGVTPETLVLGDLDGDGKADICVADADTVWCTRSP